MSEVFLQGNLVNLRMPDIDRDVRTGSWHKWFNDEQITKFLYHGVFPVSREKQVEIVRSNLSRNDLVLLAIADKESDEIVGIVSLKDIDLLNRLADITIVMGSGKYPNGAPLEAMALMTSYGFERLNLNKIQAGQHVGLWKWVNTLALIGYKLEGYIRQTHIRYGSISDSVRVGITADEYFAIIDSRKGKYLTNDVAELLKQRRKENMCQALKMLVEDCGN